MIHTFGSVLSFFFKCLPDFSICEFMRQTGKRLYRLYQRPSLTLESYRVIVAII